MSKLIFLRHANSLIESKEECLTFEKLSESLCVLQMLNVWYKREFAELSSKGSVWDILRNERGGFLGGMGLLSPTSVIVATSCVARELGDGIWFFWSKCSSNGLWPTFSNSSVSVSDSQPLEKNNQQIIIYILKIKVAT